MTGFRQIIDYFDLNKRANEGMTKYEPWTTDPHAGYEPKEPQTGYRSGQKTKRY